MNTELIIVAAAVFFAVTTVLMLWLNRKKSRNDRELLDLVGQRLDDLEANAAALKKSRDTDLQRVSEQARRIAWLESRVRQPKPVEEEELTAVPSEFAFKSIITERRHRVLTLAARGQSTEEIASTLGMMPGEVQLIVSLSRPTV